jgi:predicted phosphodiesterase
MVEKMSKKKYFVTSDIHSFFTPFKKALDEAGFDISNKNHILLILGDVFDRGNETLEVYDFLMSIPEDRLLLVKGNHEQLYMELLKKKFPQSHDFHNGTVKTFCQIADLPGITAEKIEEGYYYSCGTYFDHEQITPEAREMWDLVKEEVWNSKVTTFIESFKWKNFIEIDKYIFVHSFIPANSEGTWYAPKYSFKENWRNANDYEWGQAMWGCPWKQYKAGLLQPENEKGKTLVCGHWHAFGFREGLDGVVYKNESEIDFSTYYSKDIIALDACTALSGICNVFVVDLEVNN